MIHPSTSFLDTNNTIYMISTSSSPSSSSTMEDPPDISWDNFHDDKEILEIVTSCTTFELFHIVESVLLIEFQILLVLLSVKLH